VGSLNIQICINSFETFESFERSVHLLNSWRIHPLIVSVFYTKSVL